MERLYRFVRKCWLMALIFILLFLPPAFLDTFNRIDLVFVLLLGWIAYATVRAVRGWKTFVKQDKVIYFKRLIIFGSVVVFFLLLGICDLALRRSSTSALGVLGSNAKGYELHTLELYPYTAFHPRAYCQVKGPMPLEANASYDNFDVQSGDHGFFVDIDLDNPPPKEKDEFRLLLIGGSAAQGYGGRTNDDMFYRRLEKKLQDDFGKTPGRLRLINLAQANSTSYGNFIALNKWGHGLHPDLILSFSGYNDIITPLATGSDMPFRFQGMLGLTRATWVTESPRLLDDLSKYLPSLKTSLLAVSIRVLDSPRLGAEAAHEYRLAQFHENFKPLPYITAMYVEAFKSIKRDFQGIPIVVAFQPYHPGTELSRKTFDVLMKNAPAELQGYVNNRWCFLNVHEHFQREKLLNDRHIVNTVHLLNPGHEAVTEYLARELSPIIRDVWRNAQAKETP